MRDCVNCYNHNKPSCPFLHSDNPSDYWCYCSEEDAELCRTYCDEIEEE